MLATPDYPSPHAKSASSIRGKETHKYGMVEGSRGQIGTTPAGKSVLDTLWASHHRPFLNTPTE